MSTSSVSQISDAPDNPGRGDLSTIVESETSALSISKHIPALVEEDPVENQQDNEWEAALSSNRPLLDTLSRAGGSEKKPVHHTPGSPTPSTTLELSTSQLAEIAAEVRNAISAGSGQNGAWLGTVVVEEASEQKIDLGAEQGGDNEGDPNRLGAGLGLGDVSFNFHTLDPDLAALLSPNKVDGGNERRSGSKERLPSSTSPSMRIRAIDEGLSPSISPNLLSASSRSKGSPVPPPDHLPLLAESPQLPQSKRVFSSAKPRSLTNVPRSSQSSSPTTTHSPSSAKPRSLRSNASGPAEPGSADSMTPDRRPSASSSRSGPRPPSTPTEAEDQGYVMGGSVDRRPGSKLGSNTPFKTSTLHNPPSSRPALRQLSTQNGPWDPETISPSSRAGSSLGIAGRRQFGPRPSLDSARPNLERFERLERYSPQPQTLSQGRIRNRNRSMSESTGSPELGRQLSNQPNSGSLHRRAIDFTGPRTARLFREAGLLPKERERERDRDEETPSRQTSPVYSRSSIDRDRDYHRQMAPSRTGYSEISATSSTWGRTRATPSVVSERVGTPFTCSSSTAPTSASSSIPPLPLPVSSALQQQREDAAAYQVLKERHQMETEALLSALSDSQNLNKLLREESARVREENGQLRERLTVLEETIGVMHRERERERERERLSESRPHSRNQPTTYGASRPHMSRFGSFEHVRSGVHKRSYVSTASRPHTTYLAFGDEFGVVRGKSRAGSRLGTSSTLGSELDLISPESSPGEMVGHRRISPDHRATFMDDHRDQTHTISNGFGLGYGHPSRRFEAGMEKAKGGSGGRRAVSDTLSQRSLRESSSRSHSRARSRPDEQEDVEDGDETQHGFSPPSRKSSGHLRAGSAASSIFGVPPSNMSMLMNSSPNTDDEGLLEGDLTRRDLHPQGLPTFAFKNSGIFPPAGNLSNVSPTTASFSASQPESPGSLRLRSDHEDHLGDMESLHFERDFDDLP